MRRIAGPLGVLLVLGFAAARAEAAGVVRSGYLPLPDGTQLAYTLTLPAASGRFPVVLEYGPYAEGAGSDPTWNDAGYAMLGVNFRGTGCSAGVFNPLRADIWGKDGADAIDWAARQPWSDGNIGMLGYSFTGTSQIATAAYSGPALKAIMPGNVFPDLYRDLSYPGGVYNALTPAWIAAARQFVVGTDAFTKGATDPACVSNEAKALGPNDAQTLDTTAHPYRDDYWARDPESLVKRVRVPILGCVNWQDMTVYSRAFDGFRNDYDPRTTWVVGGDGSHTDCPISRATRVRFLDHYLKGAGNGWQQTPHFVSIHEVQGAPGRDKVPDNAGGWRTSFKTWRDVKRAIKPLALYPRAGGLLDLAAPRTDEPSDSYAYTGAPGANKPEVFGDPIPPGTELTYTTPRLAHDVEFLGSGSADLWIASTAPDTELQLMISEIRPDGQEQFVANGWLRLSQRKLARSSTRLRPEQTHREADVDWLESGTPVLARTQIQPFDHVFRAGSAIRVSIDAPSTSLVALPLPGQNTLFHTRTRPSAIVLGHLPRGRAETPLPPCGALLNQPCRAATGTVPAGSMRTQG